MVWILGMNNPEVLITAITVETASRFGAFGLVVLIAAGPKPKPTRTKRKDKPALE